MMTAEIQVRITTAIIASLIALCSLAQGQQAGQAQEDCQPRLAKPDERCTSEVTGQFYYRIKKCKKVLKWQWYEETKFETCMVYDPVTCKNEVVRKPVVETGYRLLPTDVEYTEVVCKTMTVRVDDLDTKQSCQCADTDFIKSDLIPLDDGPADKPTEPPSVLRLPSSSSKAIVEGRGESSELDGLRTIVRQPGAATGSAIDDAPIGRNAMALIKVADSQSKIRDGLLPLEPVGAARDRHESSREESPGDCPCSEVQEQRAFPEQAFAPTQPGSSQKGDAAQGKPNKRPELQLKSDVAELVPLTGDTRSSSVATIRQAGISNLNVSRVYQRARPSVASVRPPSQSVTEEPTRRLKRVDDVYSGWRASR